jgi:hypothetical protein
VKIPNVRIGDFSSKWKVPHWESVNPTAFTGRDPQN